MYQYNEYHQSNQENIFALKIVWMKEGEKKRESKNTNEHRTKGDLQNVKYFSNFIFKKN